MPGPNSNCKPGIEIALTAGRFPPIGENGGNESIIDPVPKVVSPEAGAALRGWHSVLKTSSHNMFQFRKKFII